MGWSGRCFHPTSGRGWLRAAKTRRTPCLRNFTAQSPWLDLAAVVEHLDGGDQRAHGRALFVGELRERGRSRAPDHPLRNRGTFGWEKSPLLSACLAGGNWKRRVAETERRTLHDRAAVVDDKAKPPMRGEECQAIAAAVRIDPALAKACDPAGLHLGMIAAFLLT